MVRPLDRSLCGAFQYKTALTNVELIGMPVEKAAAEQVAMRLLTASTEKPPWLTVALAWPPSVPTFIGSTERTSGRGPW